MKNCHIISVITAIFFTTNTAFAQIAEVRIGIGEFAEDILNPGTEADNGVEQSLALQGEILFAEPKFLKWALSPQPYINGTLNLEGNTNLVGAGLLWRQNIGNKFYGDFALGGSIHDGTNEIKIEDYITPGVGFDNAGYFDAFETEREFGSRILYRTQLTIGYRVSDDWATEVFFEHHSNGLGSIHKHDPESFFDFKVNDAVDTLGIRAAKRF